MANFILQWLEMISPGQVNSNSQSDVLAELQMAQTGGSRIFKKLTHYGFVDGPVLR
jgi:hypothetical protein